MRNRNIGTKLASLQDKQIDIEPEDDESEEDFIDRCTDEIGDEDVCQFIWDNRQGDETVRYKTHAGKLSDMEYVLSDETPDRMDDVIMSDGWQLDNFKKNPIALFGHRSDFPIGKWKNLRVEKKQLRGVLEFAPKGTSPRIDEIRTLVENDILRAVSVGFRPLESRPRMESDWGSFYTKAELVETSLVAVPANPNALAVAKSLNISPETCKLIFAGQGKGDQTKRKGFHGGQASRSQVRNKTMSLSQRIIDAEQRRAALREELQAHIDSIDDTNVSDTQLEKSRELNALIAQVDRTLESLKESERNLAATSEGTSGRSVMVRERERPLAVQDRAPPMPSPFVRRAPPGKEPTPLDLLVRAGTIQLFAHHLKKSYDEVRTTIYGQHEPTKFVLDWMMKGAPVPGNDWLQRAATAPAMTTVTGWAAELVQQIVIDFMQSLMPKSIFPRLSGMGLSLTFGRNGKIIIPTRSLTPTIAGSFVGEGLPIPVRQGAFTSQTLTPKKMAVITTWTREIDEHSVPAIEGLLRDAISEDTAVSLDSVLIDTNAATTVRPAGILNGVTPIGATAGGGFNAIVGDIKNISGQLLTNTKGNVRNPVWIMNPQQMNSASFIAMPGVGVFPFRDEISAGRLAGWPIIDSGTVPLGTVVATDAADFVAVGGDAPRFEVSDQATLHFDDTTPVDIGTPGTPPVAAAPAKSLWQTDSLALRLILPINWAIRRTGVVSAVVGVTW